MNEIGTTPGDRRFLRRFFFGKVSAVPTGKLMSQQR